MSTSLTEAYPVESKPLNNNPETWNFGEGWLLFNPRNSADPSASALISSDPHVKKSKITPKSIFIAPNSYTANEQLCPHGYRVDDNGKCIKTVTINQDEIFAARISELFGIDESPNKNSDIDSDYYDFDDETKSDKDSGPLQFNLPLTIDIEEEGDGKKVEYIIAEKFTVRSLHPSDVTTTTEKIEETTESAPVTESTQSVFTEEPTTNFTTLVEIVDEIITTTESTIVPSSTVKDDDDETTNSTLMTITVEPITETSSTTPVPTTTSTTTMSTTTSTPEPSTTTMKLPVQIFSVDFLPNTRRKSDRIGQASSRLKNSRDREKYIRPRKQKTTAVSTKSGDKVVTKLHKIERDQVPKKNRTRGGSKRPGYRKSTTTEINTESPVTTTTQKPFWWLPKGWSIDESKDKPVLVRFWAQQPLPNDERARSHSSHQRMNSKMPTDNIFREITAPELESMLKK